MTDVLLSTMLHSHPAMLRTSHRARCTWVFSVCWLSRNTRDEYLPKSAAKEVETTAAVTRSLLKAGLWVDGTDEWWVPQFQHGDRGIQLWKFGPLPTTRRYIPRELRMAVYRRDGYACLHCGATEGLSLDHVYPYSMGGQDTLENLQTLCRPCNSRKGARVPCPT